MVYGPIVLLLNSPLHVKTSVIIYPVVNVAEFTSSQFKSPFFKVAMPLEIVIIPFIDLLLINIFVLILINTRLFFLYIFNHTDYKFLIFSHTLQKIILKHTVILAVQLVLNHQPKNQVDYDYL